MRGTRFFLLPLLLVAAAFGLRALLGHVLGDFLALLRLALGLLLALLLHALSHLFAAIRPLFRALGASAFSLLTCLLTPVFAPFRFWPCDRALRPLSSLYGLCGLLSCLLMFSLSLFFARFASIIFCVFFGILLGECGRDAAASEKGAQHGGGQGAGGQTDHFFTPTARIIRAR
ncbi:MAG: hypothetical protein ABIP16_04735 [Thermomonas sp.]